MKILIIIFISIWCTFASAFAGPIKLSSDNRFLIRDQKPLLIIGDTGWFVFGQRGEAEFKAYLNKRKSQGFTTIWMTSMDRTPPSVNLDGNKPFLDSQGIDIRKRNMAYWDSLKRMFEYGESIGMIFCMTPSWLGFDGGWWYPYFSKRTTAELKEYGQFIGSHFKSCDNLMYFMGGDCDPTRSASSDTTRIVEAIESGIGSVDENKVITFHMAGTLKTSSVVYHNKTWLDFNQLQDRGRGLTTAKNIKADYVKVPTKPVIFQEPSYEDRTSVANYQWRRGIWYAWMSGGFGVVYGHHKVFFPGSSAYISQLDDPGAIHIGTHMGRFMKDQLWYSLKPSFDDSIVEAGSGITTDTYVARMHSGDGQRVVAYTSRQRAITINLSWFTGSVSAHWYHVTNGSYTRVPGAPFSNSGKKTITPPASGDWALALVSEGGVIPEPQPSPAPEPTPSPMPEPIPEPIPTIGANGLTGLRVSLRSIELSWKAPPGDPGLKEYGIVLGAHEHVWKRIKTVVGTKLQTTLTADDGIPSDTALLQVRAVMADGTKLPMSEQLSVEAYQAPEPSPTPVPEPVPTPVPEPSPEPGTSGKEPVVYEAEEALVVGAKIVGSYVDYLNKVEDYIEWGIDAIDGRYQLEFIYALSSGDRPLQIMINGKVVHEALPFPSTGSWRIYKSVSLSVPLRFGYNTVRATATGWSGADMDALKVTLEGGSLPEPQPSPAPEPTPTPSPEPSPTPAPEPVPPANDPVFFEAEDAELSGAKAMGSYVDYINANEDFIKWKVTVPKGRYRLQFKYALSYGNRPLEISVNGSVVVDSLSFPSTESWRIYKTVELDVDLIAGENKIRATAIGFSGANMDALIVTFLGSSTPEPAPDPVIYEAEDARLVGAVAMESYVDYIHAVGDYVEWEIQIPQTGSYFLSFRYALPSSDRPLEIMVDGIVIEPLLSFPKSSSWQNYRNVERTMVLSAGIHRIRLTAIGSSGPNIDSLTVAPVSALEKSSENPVNKQSSPGGGCFLY